MLMLSAVLLIITCVPAMSQPRGERRGEFWEGARHEVRGSRYSGITAVTAMTIAGTATAVIATIMALARAGVH